MSDDACTQSGEGETCAVPQGTGGDQPAPKAPGILNGGCCSSTEGPALGRRARRARFAAGVGFLGLAGGMATRRLPGQVSLWPAALVPTWFGIAHLVAGVTGYRGCPELGSIPSVMLGREVGTDCSSWQRIDQWIEPSVAAESLCCST